MPPLFRDSPGSPIRTTTGQSACESAGPQAGDVRENNAPPAGTAGILEQQWSQNLPAHQKMNANLIQSRFQSKRACGMVEMTRCRGTESSTSPMICLCPNGPSKRSCLPKHILSARHLLRRAPTAIFAVKQRRILVFIFLFLVNFREGNGLTQQHLLRFATCKGSRRGHIALPSMIIAPSPYVAFSTEFMQAFVQDNYYHSLPNRPHLCSVASSSIAKPLMCGTL